MEHRDIKPSNVLVTASGRVVILDFGLTSGRIREALGRDEFIGTPAYLSPEQCSGQTASTAGDWYGVGATLYHALVGRPPFEGTLRQVMERKILVDPPSVSAVCPGMPADLSGVCMGMLERDPAARVTGAQALDRLADNLSAAESSGAGAGDSVFVGREAFLRALDDTFRGVKTGRGASAFVYGPSGIGKSALVQRFIERQRNAGSLLPRRSARSCPRMRRPWPGCSR
jgi:serine/threonine protein kinase